MLLRDVSEDEISKVSGIINQRNDTFKDGLLHQSHDEEFNETVSPNPRGLLLCFFLKEKMRIDQHFCLLGENLLNKNLSILTFIMDEVFDSSLDGMGTKNF